MALKSSKPSKFEPLSESLRAAIADPYITRFQYSDLVPPHKEVRRYRFSVEDFPAFAKYFRGHELRELVAGRNWLSQLEHSATRHEAVAEFYTNTAENLSVLDLFLKLSLLQIWGSTLMQRDPLFGVCWELWNVRAELMKEQSGEEEEQRLVLAAYNAISDPDEQLMLRTFGDLWKRFADQAAIKAQEEHIETRDCWEKLLRFSSQSISEENVKRAISSFLDKARDEIGYGKVFWSPKNVFRIWKRFHNFKFDRSGLIDEELCNLWRSHYYGIRSRTKAWLELRDSIHAFCLAAGCSIGSIEDPFKSLEVLRELVSRQFVYTADLHQTISDLNKQITLQQRMITALAYRNAIENLSAKMKGSNTTEKWRSFVNQVFDSIDTGHIPQDKSIQDLFGRPNAPPKHTVQLLKPMALQLFSSLSDTIHNFRSSSDFDQYTVFPSQFDPMPVDFMSMMKPVYFKHRWEPDWDKERKRYPLQVTQTAQSTPAAPTAPTAPPSATGSKPKSRRSKKGRGKGPSNPTNTTN